MVKVVAQIWINEASGILLYIHLWSRLLILFGT